MLSIPCRSLRVLLLLVLLAPATARSQEVRIPREALLTANDLDQIFAEAAVLERERRWGEAISFYEDILRKYPGQAAIEQRLATAKAYYNLARRYSDTSYLNTLRELGYREALDLYSEVLLKIETHYVHQPNWSELVRSGGNHLILALQDPEFVRQNRVENVAERVHAFERYCREATHRGVVTRHHAAEVASLVATAAYQQLGISHQATLLEFVCGAIGALDEYSSFLTPDQLDEIFSQIEGNFVGLGIELRAEGDSLLIVHVIEGGPAHSAGILDGDRIVEVDGLSMQDISTDQAADMLKGEENSTVVVKVRSPEGATRDLRLVRRRVEVPSVEGVQMVDAENGIAYLKINSFQKTTTRDVDAALWKLYREGMKHLIIDVRGNPGGLLTSAVEIADRFVMQGAIVSTRGRSNREDFDYTARHAGTWRVPLVVLIDENSASASEIFAGAIADHQRGKIVGQQSYGKGSVQGIFPLNLSRAGLRLTTAKFYSPSGQAISKRGVKPDVLVPRPHEVARPVTTQRPATDGNVSADIPEQAFPSAKDPGLDAALRVARTR